MKPRVSCLLICDYCLAVGSCQRGAGLCWTVTPLSSWITPNHISHDQPDRGDECPLPCMSLMTCLKCLMLEYNISTLDMQIAQRVAKAPLINM